MTKDEALQMCLEYIETDAHERKYVRHAIKAALEAKDEPWEKFCDSHCVWTDHHPDCKLAKDEPWEQFYPDIGKPKLAVLNKFKEKNT